MLKEKWWKQQKGGGQCQVAADSTAAALGLANVGGVFVVLVGGLIIGIGEKLGEISWGPLVGGGIESWLAYVIALVFLLFRPQGLFGEKIIDRV